MDYDANTTTTDADRRYKGLRMELLNMLMDQIHKSFTIHQMVMVISLVRTWKVTLKIWEKLQSKWSGGTTRGNQTHTLSSVVHLVKHQLVTAVDETFG